MKETNSHCVTLRIRSDELSVVEITQIMGVSPTSTHNKGERMSASNPRSSLYVKHLWLLTFECNESFTGLLSEVASFLAEFESALLLLSRNCEMDLFCGYFPKESQDSFVIDHETVEKISRVRIDVIFDVYSG